LKQEFGQAALIQQPKYLSPIQQPYLPPIQQPYLPPIQQSYLPPVQQPYLPPIQQPFPVPNYSVPIETVIEQPPILQSSYQPLIPPILNKPIINEIYPQIPIVQQPNYPSQPIVKQSSYQTQLVPGNYSTQILPQALALDKYTLADLAPFFPLTPYKSIHQSLYYFRTDPYRNCPKNIYLNGPTYKDIEAALIFAQQQLQQLRSTNIQFLDASQPSFAARHQVFSFLNQLNARMDEDGLLIELISLYLADRACMTRWDRQRYLPQLTKLISVSQFPNTHSCFNLYANQWQGRLKYCLQSKYRTIDGFCNNPYHPYWGKSNVCHIRLLSPDYADGISAPRVSINPRVPLPNPRLISTIIHSDIPLEGPYNLMKMQWGQFINHDITNTALSSYEGLVDCCKNPSVRGCWPIYVPNGDRFYGALNVTCLNFVRSGVCPICQLGPRQQINKNTAFLDASHVYGNTEEQALKLRAFKGGLLRVSSGKNGEILLPIAQGQEQCFGTCFLSGDSRTNQHPALTALHVLMVRRHNQHALALSLRHPDWSDELIFQEARRILIAEFQMITYAEYLPIVFGPILSAYYRLTPLPSGYTVYEPKADPTTWNEYSTASCRFGHSQIHSTFGLYSKILAYGQQDLKQQTFRLKDWFMRPSFLSDGLLVPIINGLLTRPSLAVDPWISGDVRNHLYQSHREFSGGDLPATNIWRGRDHGIPGYINYIEYCFNYKVRTWKDLSLFIPYYTLNQLRKLYRVVENIDLFTGGISERHFPGADTGPTFACINGIQYYHLKFGDRYYFEHGGQAGSFNPIQLAEIKRTTLARFLCRTAYLPAVPQYAFLQASNYNPLVNCSVLGEIDYNRF